MRNETKIGIMAVIVIAIFIWGYKFLQGQNILSSSTILYAEYDDVTELQKSAPVVKNGFQVGVVADIYLKPGDPRKVIVVMDIAEDIPIPNDARAVLYSMGVMGGRGVEIDFDQPCEGANCIKSGASIEGTTKGLLGSIVDPSEIPEYMSQLNEGVMSILETIDKKMSEPGAGDGGVGKVLHNISAVLENLKSTTSQLNRLMANNSSSIKGMMTNLESVTGNLSANNDKITSLLGNAETFSGQLAEGDVKVTMEKANNTLDATKTTIEGLQTTLDKVNTTFTQLSAVLDKINKGEGSLGLLASDEKLYNNLKKATREAELLLQDVRLHPKRYTRILSKKEKPYVYPEGDPARN